MKNKAEFVEIFESRGKMYHFLSRLYLFEVDEDFLEVFQRMEFKSKADIRDLEEGYHCLREYQVHCDIKKRTTLAVDYATTFLAAGIAQGSAAFPYESAYTSKKKQYMQEECVQKVQMQVNEWYQSQGFALGEGFPKVPEDHIAIQLEFMSLLCQDEDRLNLYSVQKQFFMEHMKEWIPLFCQDVVKHAETLFYQGLGKITSGFIQWECEFFEKQDAWAYSEIEKVN